MTFDAIANQPPRRASTILLWTAAALLVVFTTVFVMTGGSGVGYAITRNQTNFLGFIISTAPYVIGALIGATASRVIGRLLSIHIPIQTAGGPETRTVWIKPFSFDQEGDYYTWLEAGKRAYIHHDHLTQAGSIGGYYGCRSVHRIKDGGIIRYETSNAEATRSLLDHNQRRLAEQGYAALTDRQIRQLRMEPRE